MNRNLCQKSTLLSMLVMVFSYSHSVLAYNLYSDSEKNLDVYGSLRPSHTFDLTGDKKGDEGADGGSRVGVKGALAVTDQVDIYAVGEWRSEFIGSSKMLKKRHGYIGFQYGSGSLSVGQQWAPYYDLVGEDVDVFNHAASPFAYDISAAPARIADLLKVSYVTESFKVVLGTSKDASSKLSKVEHYSGGLSYKYEDLKISLAYAQHEMPVGLGQSLDKIKRWKGMSLLYGKNSYMAATYQVVDDGVSAQNGSSLDFILVAPLTQNRKHVIKGSYINYQDPAGQDSYTGQNINYENRLTENFLAWVELFQRDYDRVRKDQELTVGLRVDF